VIIGLGVDDVYIILLALKKQKGYTLNHWLNAMEEIVVPVTMTSLVNASVSLLWAAFVTTCFTCTLAQKKKNSLLLLLFEYIRCLPS
jgi:hypothetical protein